MRNEVGQAIDEIRLAVATEVAPVVLPDTCRLIVGATEYGNQQCRLKSASGSIDAAAYQLRLGWGSPAIIGAAVVVDATTGRPELTLQLVEPVDSSTGVWQDWRATSAPVYGRADVGF